MSAQPIGYSRYERPAGQPGEVRYTRTRTTREWVPLEGHSLGGTYCTRTETYGLVYPAVLEPNGTLWIWRDSEKSAPGWIRGTGWIGHFEPGPEWQAQCQHQHGAVWRPCTTEAQCTALAKGEPRE